MARGRLAPSPTGVLHLGNARSFLLAWLDARARGQHVVLRIEDLDGPRNRDEGARSAIEDLRWLGLDWDAGPYEQQSRIRVYEASLGRLRTMGLAYPCVCTRKDVEEAASAPHGDEGPIYPGTCRGRFQNVEEARDATGREACWRFLTTAGSVVAFHDRVYGEQQYELAALGDFVIWKKDAEPAYQLAVVVDDADQEITDIVRGDDLLPSAARQLALHDCLGNEPPAFAHLPLVVGEDGRRLAKRHGDTTLRRLREAGMAAEELVGHLAYWSGLLDAPRAVTAQELVTDFDLDRLPRQPVVWTGDFATSGPR